MPLPLYLFTGDPYLVRRRISHWQREFAAKYDADSVVRIDATTVGLPTIAAEVLTPPMFSDKRLIIISGLLPGAARGGADDTESAADDTEKVLAIFRQIPEEHIVVVNGTGADERRSLYKALTKLDGIQHTKMEDTPEARAETAAKIAGTALAAGDMRTLLAETTGYTLGELAGALEVLALYADGKPVPLATARSVLPARKEQVVWAMTDALAARQGRRAAEVLRASLDEGESPLGMLALLGNTMGTILQLHLLAGRGKDEIASSTGLHPFVITKTLPHAAKWPRSEIQRMLDALLQLDIGRKTGEIPDDAVLAGQLQQLLLGLR